MITPLAMPQSHAAPTPLITVGNQNQHFQYKQRLPVPSLSQVD